MTIKELRESIIKRLVEFKKQSLYPDYENMSAEEIHQTIHQRLQQIRRKNRGK